MREKEYLELLKFENGNEFDRSKTLDNKIYSLVTIDVLFATILLPQIPYDKFNDYCLSTQKYIVSKTQLFVFLLFIISILSLIGIILYFVQKLIDTYFQFNGQFTYASYKEKKLNYKLLIHHYAEMYINNKQVNDKKAKKLHFLQKLSALFVITLILSYLCLQFCV